MHWFSVEGLGFRVRGLGQGSGRDASVYLVSDEAIVLDINLLEERHIVLHLPKGSGHQSLVGYTPNLKTRASESG
jgi:hypothetical protein